MLPTAHWLSQNSALASSAFSLILEACGYFSRERQIEVGLSISGKKAYCTRNLFPIWFLSFTDIIAHKHIRNQENDMLS